MARRFAKVLEQEIVAINEAEFSRLGIYSPPLQGIVVLQYTIFEVKFASFSLFGIKNTKVNCKLKGWVVCLSDMFAFDE